MRVGLLYLDALKGGGYPRDLRWLAGALAQQGLDVEVVSRDGPERDGLGATRTVTIEAAGSYDVLHVGVASLSPSSCVSPPASRRRRRSCHRSAT